MNRTTTPTRSRTASRPGKRPYLYAHSREVVGQFSVTASPPSSKTNMRSMNRGESIPSHWQQVIA